MADLYKNKVIYGGNVLIDLTSDTVDTDHLLYGYTAHAKSGAPITGQCTFDSDTTDADATANQILNSKTAYVNKVKVTGNMVNNGAISGSITTISQAYTVPVGYHDGSGTVDIDSTEKAKIIATNIRQGITILGVQGSMTGTEDVIAESPTVTPTVSGLTVLPSTGYNYISQVTINAIPYTQTQNSAGGITVTIGGV